MKKLCNYGCKYWFICARNYTTINNVKIPQLCDNYEINIDEDVISELINVGILNFNDVDFMLREI